MLRVSNVSEDCASVCSDEKMECRLCLSRYPQDFFYRLQLCGCNACEQCMTDYVEAMLNQGRVMQIPCPIKQCEDAYLTVEEIRRFLDESGFAKYQELKYLREVEVDPLKTFCPRPGCENVCSLGKRSVAYERKINSRSPLPVEAWQTRRVASAISCSKCKFEFCSVCKTRWHPKTSCEQANALLKPEERSVLYCAGTKHRHDAEASSSTSGSLTQSGAKSDCNPNVVESNLPKLIELQYEDSDDESAAKPCPVCALPIERDFGCARMQCARCNHLFCWNCLELLDEDFMWSHYENGPCKDRLGIPRIQVHTYRITAVLTMAGLGLLFLIASPVIIIAAPCILYYKFGPRERDEDNEDESVELPSASRAEKDESVEEKANEEDQAQSNNNDQSCGKPKESLFPFCNIL